MMLAALTLLSYTYAMDGSFFSRSQASTAFRTSLTERQPGPRMFVAVTAAKPLPSAGEVGELANSERSGDPGEWNESGRWGGTPVQRRQESSKDSPQSYAGETLRLRSGQAAPRTLSNPFGIAWGFLYGYFSVPSPTFMPVIRKLGGGASKIYLIWNQVEPEPGKYDWHAVDAYVNQLKSPDEGLISIFSASKWATRVSSEMLPPSPAKRPEDYDRFIRALVKHCRGKVRYWQNDSEPNNPIYWSGTAAEFVAETKLFYRAVKGEDPKAQVVLGGYDGVFNPPGTFPIPNQEHGLAFFDEVIRDAKGSFDYFDLRLYLSPETIPARVEIMRKKMQANGYERPIICTEYNGPGFFEIAANRQYIPLVMQWSASVAQGKLPQGRVESLYNRNDLPEQTQMFLMNASPELDAKYRRMQARDLVQRNVFALSAGVVRTMFWDLWHDTSKRDDVMTLMYGKLKMFEYANGRFEKEYPVAQAFARMTTALRGVRSVRQLELEPKDVLLFEADCGRRGPVYVAWRRGDPFADENTSKPFEIPWPWKAAQATDALGAPIAVKVNGGKASLPLSITPIFISR